MRITAAVVRADDSATRNALWVTRLRSKLLLERAKAVQAHATSRRWGPLEDAAFAATLRRSRWHVAGRRLPRVMRRQGS